MINILDCTLRDGGYYNAWDFEPGLIFAYLKAMAALPVNMVEIGFRTIPSTGGKFKGGCAYCTDDYIRSLDIPINGLKLGVMVNGADLLKYPEGINSAVDSLFAPAQESPVEMVRIACHVHKVEETLPAITQLHELGYTTTVQLMQIAGLSQEEIVSLSKICSSYPIDILYFADSFGSMVQDDINQTVDALRTHWKGELGFHAHNSMERAISNCIRAIDQGVTWIDGTVTGMGRGPGNACTEYLAIEMENRFDRKVNHAPLLALVDKYFTQLRQKYSWGPNPYYYMAGQYGIHPTYVQEMIGDTRYDSNDILATINHLHATGGKYYSLDTLESSRNFYSGEPKGTWSPSTLIKNREVLLLGSGPSVVAHKLAIEKYIRKARPLVMALNTQSGIDQGLIDLRLACHPVRLLADCDEHNCLPQPLITPYSMLPEYIRQTLAEKEIYDYGLGIGTDMFEIYETYGILPNSLVVSYALAVATSGQSTQLLMAGFDGYGADDPRTLEMQNLLLTYESLDRALNLISVTPTRYKLPVLSIYAM